MGAPQIAAAPGESPIISFASTFPSARFAPAQVDTYYPLADEQDKFLKEASNSVKKNAYFMRKAMDEGNLREALRYSAAMLGELRTSFLSPQKYYELYMQVFDELGNLEVGGALDS